MNKEELEMNLSPMVAELCKIEEVEGIYLFGSASHGKMHLNSDIDICVIGKEKNYIIDKLPFKEGFDIVSLWELPLSIQMRIFKEGKALFLKNKDYIDKVRLSVLKKYLDLKPLINRYCQERFGCTI